jgi:hypothetical protein
MIMKLLLLFILQFTLLIASPPISDSSHLAIQQKKTEATSILLATHAVTRRDPGMEEAWIWFRERFTTYFRTYAGRQRFIEKLNKKFKNVNPEVRWKRFKKCVKFFVGNLL